jgi:rhomboid family GlyGly-CTERM serine protease
MTIARSLNGDGRYGVGLALTVALLLLPLLGGMALRDAWRYEREAIAAGQWWRLLTCHLVHLDAGHALLNAVGLALLWALFARSYRLSSWLLAMALSTIAIGCGFWFLSTQLHWYVGASGLLHGVFACGCLAMMGTGDRIGFIAGALFVAKLAWEQWHGPLPFERADQVVTVAHLYGAIGGALAGLLLRPRAQGYTDALFLQGRE